MMEKPHLYKIFKYSRMNKTVVKTIIEMHFIINKMLNYFFIGGLNFCGRGIISDTNLGTTVVIYKTK